MILNSNFEQDILPGSTTDLNTTKCIISIVNGLESANIGFPSDFNNTWGIFIQNFRYPTDRNGKRVQVLISTAYAKIWTRESYWDDTYQKHIFTDWVSNT